MSKNAFLKKLGCMSLVFSMLLSLAAPVKAVEDSDGIAFHQVDNNKVSASLLPKVETTESSSEPVYADTDKVRVSIMLQGDSVMDRGFSTLNLAENTEAMSYRGRMIDIQDAVTMEIEDSIGEQLDVQWNLTLAANIIAADVEYGQIAEIEAVEGVEKVIIETRYDVPEPVEQSGADASPLMYSATDMLGMGQVWSSGYTGAGMRVAIIDTGLDTDHQSFSAEAYLYALEQNAAEKGMSYEDYVIGLDLLDKNEIANKIGNLNIQTKDSGVTGHSVYKSEKVPFAFNYIDATPYYVTHDQDSQTDHGSHVAGIAAANRYIKVGDEFKVAEDYCNVVGNAPDAQLIVMKVFGKMGGAYTSDFMAAIEDAIVLGCDSVNLSLGSTVSGFADAGSEYQEIMNKLQDPKTNPGSVVVVAAGNEYNPVQKATNSKFLGTGHLYAEDAVMPSNIGSPGSYTNSLTVASVNNKRNLLNGYFAILDEAGSNAYLPSYAETLYNKMKLLTSLDTSAKGTGVTYDYVFIDGLGKPEDLKSLDLKGKVFICSRGELAFYEKANYAAEAGAAAIMIYNNDDGVINMDLSSYGYEAPAVSLTKEVGATIRSLSAAKMDENNKTYFEGKMKIVRGQLMVSDGKNHYVMSDFSSWGTTGDLALKPEISAPGGNIYSVKGDVKETDKYKTNSGTSMATPQVAGVTAAASQFLQETGFAKERGFSQRQLLQSLIMSTAEPLKDGDGQYYPLFQQGAGLLSGSAIVGADSFIMMGENATPSYADGKIKAELGDDPKKTGIYSFDFTIYNEANTERTFTLSAEAFTQDVYKDKSAADSTVQVWYSKNSTVGLDSKNIFIVDNMVKNDGAEITIPAGGSKQITARIDLTDAAKSWLDERYPNGAYMQAFVYARSSDAEGNAASTHSIPVLAFYGSWTGPSMFDTASYSNGQVISKYNTVNTTDKSRVSYAWQKGTDYESYYGKNYVVVTSSNGDGYALGGNPLVRDDSYLEERNAIGNGVSVEHWSFGLFRDAAKVQSAARNLSTGEPLYEEMSVVKNINSSYYDKRNLVWQYVSSDFYVRRSLPAAKEDDVLELSLTAVPEYYLDGRLGEKQSVGEGATLSITAVIDETAPVVSEIVYNKKNGTLEVTAQDNNFISAVVLYSEDGSSVVSYTGANQEVKKGESAIFTVKPNTADGEGYLLQIFDYALNVCTYYIELEEQQIVFSGSMLAFDLESNRWVQLDKLSDQLKPVTRETKTYTAATAVDDVIYAIAYGTELHRLSVSNAQDSTIIGDTGIELVDLAYNAADGVLYGITADSKLAKINLNTAKGTVIGSTPVNSNTLACDENGVFYSNLYGSGKIYSYTIDALRPADLRYDFNSDNVLNDADGQALLDYIAGCGDISKEENADLDGDGDVDTRDAYLLLDKIPNRASLVCNVPVVSKYLQAMEIDPNSGALYWSSYCSEHIGTTEIGFSVLYEIDTETGAYQHFYDVWDQLTCLLVLDKDVGSGFAPLGGVTDLTEADKDKLYKYQNAVEQMRIASTSGVDNSQKAQLLSQENEDRTAVLSLSSDHASTNGLYTVNFDPEKLTFVSLQGNGEWNSHQVDKGTVAFAYAGKMTMGAGAPLAELVFEVGDCSASVTVTKRQENRDHMEKSFVVELSAGHSWGEWNETKAPSCLSEGTQTRICSDCGDSETQSISKLTEHNWAAWYSSSEPTADQPVSEYRYCNDCSVMEYRWAVADSMNPAEVESCFGLFNINKNRIASARFYGTAVNSVKELTASDGRMSYLVELSEKTDLNAVFSGRLEVTKSTGSGYGNAITKNKVDSVGWDEDELDYVIELKNGIGTLTAYSYTGGTNCVPLEIYFYIGEGGNEYAEPFYLNTPGSIGKMGIWGAVVEKTYWGGSTYEDDMQHKRGYIWLASDTAKDADVKLEFITSNDVYEGWKNEGVNINRKGLSAQLENGAAEFNFYSEGICYTLYLKNYINQAPAPYLSTGSASVGRNQEYCLDLSTVFYDLNGDTMTYEVSINGAKAVNADENWAFRPAETGEMKLIFTASDSTLTSEPYTLTLTVTESSALIGDIDSNGTINLKDATRLMKYLANWDVEVNITAADTNGDGKVNLKDATHLMKYLAGWAVALG